MTRTTRLVLGVLAVDAVVFWAMSGISSTPSGWVAGLVAGTTPLVFLLWREHRTPAMRRDQDTAARALADHRDPGPAHRAVTDERARSVLAHPGSDRWLPPVLALGLAVACVVAAVLQDDVTVAFPAVPLAALGAAFPGWYRRRTTAAARWLDDPPYEREQA
jgi:hypothetical protein